MVKRNKVIDYVKEQADRYDSNNLQYEQDVIYQIRRITDKYILKIINRVNTDITSVLIMSKMMMGIESIMNEYVTQCKKILMGVFDEYSETAYNYTNDLIDLGTYMNTKLGKVSELKANRSDKETLEYIQQYSFDLIKGHSYQKIEQIRSKLGDLFLNGKADRATVRDAIEKILNVTTSKAEEIAQTELSRAYNYGTLRRLRDYKNSTGEPVKKYWHGFKYSDVTCNYCRDRIGSVYDINDTSEELPTHPRCRCVWIPILDGWDTPVDVESVSQENMDNTTQNIESMYQRIDSRLGINYARYLSDEVVNDYLSGERTTKIENALNTARKNYISDMVDSFNIDKDNSTYMAEEFNTQMNFWKKYIAGAMADNKIELLDSSIDAINGVRALPWNAEQLDKWDMLIDKINGFSR